MSRTETAGFKRLRFSLFLLLAAALLSGVAASEARASDPPGLFERPITWSFTGIPKEIIQGEEFGIVIRAGIDPGWHLYSMTQGPPVNALSFTILDRGSPFLLARTIVAPEPDIAWDANFDMPTETYLDSLVVPMRLLAKTAGRKSVLRVVIHYQACTDTYCLPPFDDTLKAVLSVNPGVVDEAVIAAAPPEAEIGRVTVDSTVAAISGVFNNQLPAASTGIGPAGLPANVGTESFLLFLAFAALMGAVSLLTPCVFPMVPITVSYFTHRGEVSRGKALRQAAIYAGGIVATFTALGMAIALLFGAGGVNRFAANPWINLVVTVIFVGFALTLFGLFSFTVPSGLLTRLDALTRSESRNGTVGALLMGFTFTLTSFTCTAPLVGSLLVTAAQGEWTWPLLGLLVFSGVFALPFFFLALVPSAVQRLPRSGAWLGLVKPVLGCIELAMAFKFLSNADLILGWGIFTRNTVLAIWFVLSLVIVVLLLGLLPRLQSRLGRPSWGRLILGAGAIALAVVLGRGLNGARIGELESFLPPREGRVVSGTTAVDGELSWIVNDYQLALEQARAEGKAVLIDFTGYTCTNCRWMEANMFPRPEVVAELEHFVRVRLYTDGRGEPYVSQQAFEQETFNTVALPLYAVMDVDGNPHGHLIGMRRSSEDFTSFLAASRAAALAARAQALRAAEE